MTASGHVEPKLGQAIRRKPVIQSGPAEKIPSRSPTTASGREPPVKAFACVTLAQRVADTQRPAAVD